METRVTVISLVMLLCCCLSMEIDLQPSKHCNSKIILGSTVTKNQISKMCLNSIKRYEKKVAETKEGQEYMTYA